MPQTIVEWIILIIALLCAALCVVLTIGFVWLAYHLVTSPAFSNALGY